jgi:hypothetical protein
MKKYKCVLALSLAAILVPAAAPRSSSHATPPRAQTGEQRLSDGEIEQNIRAKLAKSKIGKDGFTVHVKGGVATWEGHTSVVQHKGAATRMAKTAGSLRVVNNIVIVDGARPGQGLRHPQVKTE